MIKDILKILDFVVAQENSAFFYTPLNSGNEKCYLFKKPALSIGCENIDEIHKTLNDIEHLAKKYEFAYGSITYEAGYFFEDKLKSLLKGKNNQFIKFNFFNSDEVEVVPTKLIHFKNIQNIFNEKFEITKLELNETQAEYEKKIEKIKKYISKGDTYQVNYTLKAKFGFNGKVSNLITHLLFKQSASYTSIINDVDNFIISISPELFFKTGGNKIISKPMKGTIKRGINLIDDYSKNEQLKSSKKDKAENIMIVDLLRNDIGKLSKFNSVLAFPLCEIEKYETLYQMTSTVSGELKSKSFSKIIKNLFPCGSITGAPKIRTMQIINELENEKRGIYTGTIGIIQKNDFTFNIPIRTILLNKLTQNGEVGLGSGITWDSNAKSEFEETKLKSEFLVNKAQYFELIETMLIENGEIFLLENHINRLKQSSEYFLFYLDELKLRKILNSIVSGLKSQNKFKLKLLLTKWGEIKFNLEHINKQKFFGRIAISEHRINSQNKFQYFKTTNRNLYDSELKRWQKKGFDDVIFLNENGYVTEGAITNIMFEHKSKMITPPISDGLLNGCYRKYLLSKDKNIVEKSFGVDELYKAQKVIIYNSVRKENEIKEIFI